MEDKYRPIDFTPATVTGRWKVLALAWSFAALFALWAAEDLRNWLVWDEESTGTVEEMIGDALLSASRTLHIAQARAAFESALSSAPEPPKLLVRVSTPPSPQAKSSAPRRILLVGASSIEYVFGTELERALEAYGGVEVRRLGKLGTGLSRPGVYDWPLQVARQQTEFQPDVVLGQFAGNDCQTAIDPLNGRRWAFGTKSWEEEYSRRVARIARDVKSKGSRMIFLGQLAVRKESIDECYAKLDVVTERAALEAGAEFLSLRPFTQGKGDKVLETITGAGGKRLKIWGFDDVHLNRDGSRFVVAQVCAHLERRIALESADLTMARVRRFESVSAARNRTIPWYAVTPRQVPEGGLPVLFLLHGGGGSLEDWLTHAQEPLQRLAAKHGLAIVLPDGDQYGWYVDGLPAGTGIETYLMKELLPEVEKQIPTNGKRGIAGLSMGGHGALVLALRHPGTFRSASSMSGVVDLLWDPNRPGLAKVLGDPSDDQDRWKDRSARQILDRRPEAFAGLALKLTVGDRDKFLEPNRAFHRALEQRAIPHLYDESPGAHDWTYWTGQLDSHVSWHAEQLKK